MCLLSVGGGGEGGEEGLYLIGGLNLGAKGTGVGGGMVGVDIVMFQRVWGRINDLLGFGIL